MKVEKIILSFVAVLVGLLVAGVAFFLYQSTKTLSPNQARQTNITLPTPTPKLATFLTIDSPVDESVTNSQSITISGKTTGDATIILTTPTTDQVIIPVPSTGNYSATTTIQNGENEIIVTSIAPNGDEVEKKFTITYSTESF